MGLFDEVIVSGDDFVCRCGDRLERLVTHDLLSCLRVYVFDGETFTLLYSDPPDDVSGYAVPASNVEYVVHPYNFEVVLASACSNGHEIRWQLTWKDGKLTDIKQSYRLSV